jgi:hypothetical protein
MRGSANRFLRNPHGGSMGLDRVLLAYDFEQVDGVE